MTTETDLAEDAREIAGFMKAEGWEFILCRDGSWAINPHDHCSQAAFYQWEERNIRPVLAKINADPKLFFLFCEHLATTVIGFKEAMGSCNFFLVACSSLMTATGPQLARAAAMAIRGMR